jgi:hypothetical protein
MLLLPFCISRTPAREVSRVRKVGKTYGSAQQTVSDAETTVQYMKVRFWLTAFKTVHSCATASGSHGIHCTFILQ